VDRGWHIQGIPESGYQRKRTERGTQSMECKVFLLGPKLIQAIRELIECNETHVWVYDICQFSRLYPEHQNFGDGGKADFVEAAMCYIYDNGGEAEVIRLFQGLWRALVRLAVGTYRRVPTYLRFSKT